jgi:hypothetical protein
MSLTAIGPNHQTAPTKPAVLPGNPKLGNRQVKNITGGVMDIWEDIKHKHNSMSDTEQGYYYIAAICVALILLLVIVLASTGGFAAIGLIGAQAIFYPLIAVVAGCILRGKYLTSEREPWQMPRISSHMQGDPVAESEWKRLWDVRNQAKLAHKNVSEVIVNERLMRDVSRDEEHAKHLLKAYEKAEVDFWQFADEEKAYEKIDEFNEARTKRGETEML